MDPLWHVLNTYSLGQWLITAILGVLLGFFFVIPIVIKRPFLSLWVVGVSLAFVRSIFVVDADSETRYKAIAGVLSWTVFIGCVWIGKRILEHAFGRELVKKKLLDSIKEEVSD